MRYIMKLAAKYCTVFAVLSLLVFVLSASAEDKGMKPCADDVAKFCKDVKPGEGRIVACLKEHQNDLSASCKEKMEKLAEVRKKGSEMNKACHDDISKFCKDVKPGGGKIIQCLKEHSSDLSIECKGALPQGKK